MNMKFVKTVQVNNVKTVQVNNVKTVQVNYVKSLKKIKIDLNYNFIIIL